MLSLITLPEGFVSEMTGWIGNVFTDLSPLIVVAIGLPLAFWGIARVIGLFRMRTRRS